jgi:hypothetical protein
VHIRTQPSRVRNVVPYATIRATFPAAESLGIECIVLRSQNRLRDADPKMPNASNLVGFPNSVGRFPHFVARWCVGLIASQPSRREHTKEN